MREKNIVSNHSNFFTLGATKVGTQQYSFKEMGIQERMNNTSNIPLPNFFCLGVAKSGTTTLHHALLHHPDIFLPQAKETFFFSSNIDYKKGINWYLNKYFTGAGDYSHRGEIASTYMYHGDSVVQRLSEIYQKQPLKLIVIFRDPVHRAYSHYWHMIRLGWEKHSFQKAIEIEGKRRKGEFAKNAKNGRARFAYIESGLYATRLQPFLDRFEKKQFLFLFLYRTLTT